MSTFDKENESILLYTPEQFFQKKKITEKKFPSCSCGKELSKKGAKRCRNCHTKYLVNLNKSKAKSHQQKQQKIAKKKPFCTCGKQLSSFKATCCWECYVRENKAKIAIRMSLHNEKNQYGIETQFKKGNTPWNKGKKGRQIAWNKGLRRMGKQFIKV